MRVTGGDADMTSGVARPLMLAEVVDQNSVAFLGHGSVTQLRVDIFFTTTASTGTLEIREPHKCTKLIWADPDD